MGIPVCFIDVICKFHPKESITPPVNVFACRTALCFGGCHVHLLSLISHRDKQLLLLTLNSIHLVLIPILSGKLLCITDSSKHLHIHRAPMRRLYIANRAVPRCLDALCC